MPYQYIATCVIFIALPDHSMICLFDALIVLLLLMLLLPARRLATMIKSPHLGPYIISCFTQFFEHRCSQSKRQDIGLKLYICMICYDHRPMKGPSPTSDVSKVSLCNALPGAKL